MGEDASIDEFETAADDAEAADSTDATGNAPTEAGGEGTDSTAETSGHDAGHDTEPIPDDVAPTVTIYGWTPRNATCEVCGESAKRRWRDGDAMVCSECKEW